MSSDSLDTLLVKLRAGEEDAAARVFRDYEPFLRAMVRRRLTPALRSKFDSIDVVQSVWADVLEGYREEGLRFTDRDHLRAFLARVTYNHFSNYCRRHGPTLRRERPMPADDSLAATTSPQPRPSQVVQADELWDRMTALCPPAHRRLLELKRQGFALAEIAERTGLHEGSVRRILYELARRMADSREKAPRRATAEG